MDDIVIVCNRHRFIFVHLHKTGGTSVTRALDPLLGWNDVICGATQFGNAVDRAYRQRFGLHKHCHARDIRAVVGEEIWREYFTFAFARNPYSRAVSLYTYIHRLLHETQRSSWRRFVPKLRRDGGNPSNWPATFPGIQPAVVYRGK